MSKKTARLTLSLDEEVHRLLEREAHGSGPYPVTLSQVIRMACLTHLRERGNINEEEYQRLRRTTVR